MESVSRGRSHCARVIHTRMERIIDDFFALGSRRILTQPTAWEPRADVYETETALVIQVELSGIAREEIDLCLQGDRLYLRGVRPAPENEPQKRYRQVEIPCGTFERVFQLPPDVLHGEITAKLKDGLLTVTLTKAV